MANKANKASEKPKAGNPWGHFRKRQSSAEFAGYFDRHGDVAVLKGFMENTASWVYENFGALELEVHQAVTIGVAARQKKQGPDYAAIKNQFPRLAVVATDTDLKEILETDCAPKKVTVGILSRILQREKSSIKKWAQGKK
jgi:hypothetical protein